MKTTGLQGVKVGDTVRVVSSNEARSVRVVQVGRKYITIEGLRSLQYEIATGRRHGVEYGPSSYAYTEIQWDRVQRERVVRSKIEQLAKIKVDGLSDEALNEMITTVQSLLDRTTR